MFRFTHLLRRLPLPALVAGLALLAAGAARAQKQYQIQPIVKLGDTVGDLRIASDGDIEIGTLNDHGQLIFTAENTAGGEALLQYTDGKFTPIVGSGRDAPGGKWSRDLFIPSAPVSMNQFGNLVFVAPLGAQGKDMRTFVWEAREQKVAPVVLPGMPAANDVTFAAADVTLFFDGTLDPTPVINRSNEIAFVAPVKNAAGKPASGVFFLGRDGKLLPIAFGDQALPGGGKLLRAGALSLNDAGTVAFLAQPQEGDPFIASAYLWEQGTITPIALVGTDAPGGGKFAAVTAVRVNNKNRDVWVAARVGAPNVADGLYRFTEGKWVPVAVPGQEMPGGGRFKQIPRVPDAPPLASFNISRANEAGQHAFLATLADGTTAAYLADADGQLSLVLKSGTTTELGRITRVGQGPGQSLGVGLNTQGQVAVGVSIEGGRHTLVLLTPAVP